MKIIHALCWLLVLTLMSTPAIGQKIKKANTNLHLSTEELVNEKLKIGSCPDNVPIVDREIVELNKVVNSTYPIF